MSERQRYATIDAIVYHLQAGNDNAGIGREALVKFLEHVKGQMDNLLAKNEELEHKAEWYRMRYVALANHIGDTPQEYRGPEYYREMNRERFPGILDEKGGEDA